MVRRGFGGRSGSAVQDVDNRLRHWLVGVGEEEADLPHLGIAELGFEGGHSGEADAVLDLPVGFADWIVADSDYVWLVVVGFEELRGIGIHVIADCSGVAVQAVTDGAAFDVDAGTRGEVSRIRLHVCSGHFVFDAGLEWDVDELAFMGKGGIGNGDGNLSVHEIDEYREGN